MLHGVEMIDEATSLVLGSVLGAYGLSEHSVSVERSTTGNIHLTLFVRERDGSSFVVQRMHPIFSPEVLFDTEAVTKHVAEAGLETPRLVRTADGRLCTRDEEGKTWRVMTYLEGVTYDRLTEPRAAESAGGLVARFHRAASTLAHEFRFVRAGVHDTALHLAQLERARDSGRLPELMPLADEILDEARRLPVLGALPKRIVHGDLKISNVLFGRDSEKARALLDLDTLGHQTLAYELGDALRSWCNLKGEDVEIASFDASMFLAAVHGYAAEARSWITLAEFESLVPGLLTVCVELAARFALDAYDDKYFGWNPAKFSCRREHNRVRAQGQLSLAKEIASRRSELENIVQGERVQTT